jgi:hypothetical protein
MIVDTDVERWWHDSVCNHLQRFTSSNSKAYSINRKSIPKVTTRCAVNILSLSQASPERSSIYLQEPIVALHTDSADT